MRHLKILERRWWHESNSTTRIHKFKRHGTKLCCPHDLAARIWDPRKGRSVIEFLSCHLPRNAERQFEKPYSVSA
jgi:hypothetical protein